jgi:putative transposase
MKQESNYPKRKLLRLKDFDYSTEAAYFVTIHANDNEELFGKIVDEKMILNDIGKMIGEWWKKLEQKYKDILLDEYIVMPNHFHGIIMIIKDDYVREDPYVLQRNKVVGDYVGADPRVRPQRNIALSDILQWFKTMTTNEYIKNVKSKNWKPFNKKLWQRSYYD